MNSKSLSIEPAESRPNQRFLSEAHSDAPLAEDEESQDGVVFHVGEQLGRREDIVLSDDAIRQLGERWQPYLHGFKKQVNLPLVQPDGFRDYLSTKFISEIPRNVRYDSTRLEGLHDVSNALLDPDVLTQCEDAAALLRFDGNPESTNVLERVLLLRHLVANSRTDQAKALLNEPGWANVVNATRVVARVLREPCRNDSDAYLFRCADVRIRKPSDDCREKSYEVFDDMRSSGETDIALPEEVCDALEMVPYATHSMGYVDKHDAWFFLERLGKLFKPVAKLIASGLDET